MGIKDRDIEKLYKLKIAALLHDPPHKPFALRKHKNHEKIAENIADNLFGAEISKLLRDKHDKKRVKLSDKVASSFDRWILSILMGERYISRLFKYYGVKVKNIVAPSLSIEIPEEYSGFGEDPYNDELKDILSASNDWKLKYHLLYLFYEALWILKGLSCGPADTRVPTHSVFDHNYATATMINWMLQDTKQVKGLLVGLDVAGVQDYIAASRKVRDAWISSYIVSALTWYTIIELIDKLGPDVLLMPSLRLNPFYLYWLENKLTDSQVYEKIGKRLKDVEALSYISGNVLKMYRDLGIPPYPIIPGRATLVLPSKEQLKNLLGIKGLRKYFAERFKKGWELLWKTAKRFAERRVQTKHGEDLVWSFINRVFNYYDKAFKKAGFIDNPPLGIRVEWVEISANSNDKDLWLLYDSKYHELTAKLGLAKYRRKRPETKLNLYILTKQAFESKALGYPKLSSRGFDYCTLCGKLPAVVVLSAREGEKPEENEFGLLLYRAVVKNEEPDVRSEKIEENDVALNDEFKNWLDQHRGLMETFKSLFSPGEKLCPWCFLKRVLSIEPRLLKILLIGGDEDKIDEVIDEAIKESDRGVEHDIVRTWFPSLAHIASARLYEKIANLEQNDFRGFFNKVSGFGLIARYKHPPIKTWTWYFMEKIHNKIHEKIESLEERDKIPAKSLAKILIQCDPENLWFDPCKRNGWSNIFSKFGLSKWCWRYYALVRADGDSIGDLLEGKLTSFLAGKVDRYVYDEAIVKDRINESEKGELRKLLHNYIINSCEGEFRKFMEFCFSKALKKKDKSNKKDKIEWARRISRYTTYGSRISINKALKSIDRVIRFVEEIVSRSPRIIVSPSYHVAVSAALMRAALIDVAIITELDGVVAYAGGDDLMAFIPVDKALDAVRITRKGFAGSPINMVLGDKDIRVDLVDGFLRINNSYLPLLPSIGRSYCVYIAHYHYPLAVVVTSSLELLESIKERYSIEYLDCADKRFIKSEKDMLVVAYNPRATEEYALIPLTLKRPIISLGEGAKKARDDVSKIACSITFVEKVLKLMDERLTGKEQVKLSRSLLYDASEIHYANALTTLIDEAEKDVSKINDISYITQKLIQAIIRRNTELRREADGLDEELLKLLEVSSIPLLALVRERLENDERKHTVALCTIGIARLVRNGMR